MRFHDVLWLRQQLKIRGLLTFAIFRQINKEEIAAHHDTLEFPDGEIVLVTSLSERLC